jgi:hypothetical protein
LRGACELLIYEPKNELACDAKSIFFLQKNVRAILCVPLLYLVPSIFYCFAESWSSWIYCLNALYIWSEHYTRKAKGQGLFDHQKPAVVQGCLNVMRGYFLLTFFIFCYFLTICNFVNYFLLLKGAKWVVLIYFWIVRGEGCAFIYLFW